MSGSSSGISSKLKLGLVVSISCAFTYLGLVYTSHHLDQETNSNSVLHAIPQKVRNLYNNSRIVEGLWDQFDSDNADVFVLPPFKPFINSSSQENNGEAKEQKVEVLQPDKHEVKEAQKPSEEAEAKVEVHVQQPEIQDPKEVEKPTKAAQEKKVESPEETSDAANGSKLKGVSSFKDALSMVASSDKKVLLTLVDLAFHGMAVNYYLTCLKPFEITNYIILTMHPDTCTILEKHNINCFFYRDMSKGDQPSKWGTQIFKDKMNVRTDFVLDALRLNFSVLHTDIDMFCFKSVMESVSCPRESCDIAPTDGYVSV